MVISFDTLPARDIQMYGQVKRQMDVHTAYGYGMV